MYNTLCQIILIAIISFGISGCSFLWISDVNKSMLADKKQWYFYFTDDITYKPGTATPLPLDISNPVQPAFVLEECGIEPKTYSQQKVVYPDFSKSMWMNLSNGPKDEKLKQLDFVSDLMIFNSEAKFVSIKFTDLEYIYLEPELTTLNFYTKHVPPWTVVDIIKLLDPYVIRNTQSNLYNIHQLIKANIELKFWGWDGFLADVSQRHSDITKESQKFNNFFWNSQQNKLQSVNKWVVARRSRLKLDYTGWFERIDGYIAVENNER